MSFCDEKEANIFFKELPWYNDLIEKPCIKCPNNTDMLRDLPFCDELNTVKTSNTFKGYARSYSIEIDPSVQFPGNEFIRDEK